MAHLVSIARAVDEASCLFSVFVCLPTTLPIRFSSILCSLAPHEVCFLIAAVSAVSLERLVVEELLD